MAGAALWGAAGASSLLLGAVIGLALPPSDRVNQAIGLVLGFGAGALISALAFELTQEAFHLGGADAVAIGLAAGGITYFAGNEIVHRRGAGDRMSPKMESEGESASLLFGAVLDGIPESVVIGISLLEGGTVAIPVLAAVFISNLPEALGAAHGTRRGGAEALHVLGKWAVVVLVAAISAALGYGLLENASGNAVGLIQAFAGGAVLAMLAETMIPEALKQGHRVVGLATVLGFALAYLLSTLK